jgi:hypothetical protein
MPTPATDLSPLTVAELVELRAQIESHLDKGIAA